MDRRTTIKWVLAASASLPLGRESVPHAAQLPASAVAAAKPYGTDPKLLLVYAPGDLWPLTFTPEQRATATVLSDLILPADSTSPSASAVGVIDFLDEWISAPYAAQQEDRNRVLGGFEWLDAESLRRFSKAFRLLAEHEQREVCDDICYLPTTQPPFMEAAKFFARYRDLTAGGFYTSPQGRADLQYVGNVPLASFAGPPPDVLKRVGLL